MAGFARRYLARTIDGVVAIVVVAVLAGLGKLLPDGSWLRAPWDHAVVARTIMAGAYEVGFLIAWGATPGKRVLGIEIVDTRSSERLGPRAAVVRTALWMGVAWVPKIGFVLPLLFVLPILWSGVAVHDYLSRTWVVVHVDEPDDEADEPDEFTPGLRSIPGS